MREPSPEVQSLFNDLRAADPVTPDSLDDAWQRFEAHDHRARRPWVAPVAVCSLLAAALAVAWFAAPNATGIEQEEIGRSPVTAVFGAASQRSLRTVRAESEAAHRTKRTGSPENALPGAQEPAPPTDDAPLSLHDADGSQDGPKPESKPRKPARPPQSATAAAESQRTLKDELQLLDAAERAFRNGDLSKARAIVAKHAERFPTAVLARERQVLRRKIDEASVTIQTPG